MPVFAATLASTVAFAMAITKATVVEGCRGGRIRRTRRRHRQQAGQAALRILATLLVIAMLAAVGYLWVLRSTAPQPQPQPQSQSLGPADQSRSADPSAPPPLTPQQLMSLKPVAADAMGQSGAGDGRSNAAPLSLPLPALNASDGPVRSSLIDLDSSRLLADWLVDEELVRKFVVMVDNMANGQIPRKHSVLKPLKDSFRVREKDDQYYLNGYNFSRYSPYVESLLALDPVELSRLYQHYYPLFQQAYGELGYSRRSFHRRVLVAVDQLLASPVVEGPIELTRPSVMYKYADPQLEQLSDVHKQMLRLGPEKARLLKARLAVLRSLLTRLDHR